MSKQIEALKMAIEAMETSKEAWHEIGIYDAMYDGLVLSIQACKEALAEAEKQEILSDEELKDLIWERQDLLHELIDLIELRNAL